MKRFTFYPHENFLDWAYSLQLLRSITLVLLISNFSILYAQDWQEVLASTASDAASGNLIFGNSVSVSGNYAIIGGLENSFDAAGGNLMLNSGAAYIFERDEGGNWSETQKIVASDREAGARFGSSVFIEGNYAYVGAFFESKDASGGSSLSGAGAVYIFELSGGTWTQIQKIVASDREGFAYFGTSLSVSGDYLITGAYSEEKDAAGGSPLSDAGAAYIFERSGGVWSQMQKIVGSLRSSGDFFGQSVAISGDYAIVGATSEDLDAAGSNSLSNAGAAYIFERSGATWSQAIILVSASREANATFGIGVSISGNYAVVGCGLEDTDAAGGNALSSAGAAYIYERSGTWSQMQKVVASSRATFSFFGEAVSLDGNNLLIGASGEKRDASEANSLNGAGATYLFQLDGGTWTQSQKMVASDRASNDDFGGAVAISGDYAVSGAYGNSNGYGYIFEFPRWTFPHGGYALGFDGTDDYVETSYDAALNPSNFTIEAWAKVEGGAGTYRSVMTSRKESNTGGYIIYAGVDNQWQFWTGNNTAGTWHEQNSGVAVSDEWTHLACSFDGTSKRIYINGILANSSVTSFTQNTSAPLRIGAGATEGTPLFYFPGQIDEVRIWSDVRSQAEIQANMNKELAGDEANLEAYYLMYDSTGTSLSDNSNNENTGTLSNGPTWKTSGALSGSDMALNFDGDNDEVQATVGMTPTDTITLETWIQFKSLTGQQNPLRLEQSATSIRMTVAKEASTNILGLYLNDGVGGTTINTSTVIEANKWYHLVFIQAEDSVTFYVNGEKVPAQFTTRAFRSTASNDFYIGASNGTLHGDVIVDEIRIWDDIRTQAEIRANKNRILRGDETNLVAYYRFDQQADAGNTTLYDITSNGNDGTLTNMDGATDWVASSPFNTWIGSEDSDWSNTDNWSSGSVPSTEDVGVYAWSGNNLPTSANISARNFYLDNGVSLNHSGNLTLSGDYYNAGTFTTTGNVTFSGSVAQNIRGTGTSTFGTLTVNNSAGVTLGKNVSTTSSLTLTSGDLNLNSQTLALGNSASIGGSPGSSSHVIATSGNLTKGYSGTGSFAFPVGDGTSYTPITLNFTSGTFASGNAGVNLTVAKHPNNSSSSDFISRYWTVSSSGISDFSCAVTGSYDDTDISGTEGDMVGGKWDGSSWTDLGSVTPGSNQVTGTVTSFSDFTAGEPTAFPVEWLDFRAEFTKDNLVQLDWITANELNADFFAIERSQDQNQWNQLGMVQATGNSQEPVKYRYQDLHPLRGNTYYRLRQVDIDGAFEYSSTVEVNWNDHPVLVYPNPVVDLLHIELPGSASRKLQIFDIHGRLVLKANLISGKHSIHIAHLSPGRYILQLKDKKGRIEEFQVVKE